MPPDQNGNASTDRLLGRLIERTESFGRELGEIRRLLDKHVDDNDDRHGRAETRISLLENQRAELKGSWRVLAIIGSAAVTIAGVVGGMISNWLGNS